MRVIVMNSKKEKGVVLSFAAVTLTRGFVIESGSILVLYVIVSAITVI